MKKLLCCVLLLGGCCDCVETTNQQVFAKTKIGTIDHGTSLFIVTINGHSYYMSNWSIGPEVPKEAENASQVR